MRVVFVIDNIDENALVTSIMERLFVELLVAVILNFDSNGIDEHNEMVSVLVGRGSYTYAPKKFNLDLKNRATLKAQPFI